MRPAHATAPVWRAKAAIMLLATLTVAGCGGGTAGPPEIVVDRTSCDGCRMLVSDVRYAAAVQGPAAESRVFDDIGCLLEAVKSQSTAGLTFWFRDASDGQWIPGTQATFVSAPTLRTPMSGGVVAYRDRAVAEQAAGQDGGRIFRSLAELLESKKAGS